MKNIFLFILFFFQMIVFSQTKNDSISLSLNNETVASSLKKIEQNFGFTFYYNQKWLDEEKKVVTENFNNLGLDEVLTKIFSKTNLNFFIDNNKVILTQNRIIYDYFVDNYFVANDSEKGITTNGNSIQDFDDSTIYIGKQRKTKSNEKFILSGYLKNLDTNEPLSNTLIKVKNKIFEAETDSTGFYSLELPAGTYTIFVALLNAKENQKKIYISENGTLDFQY